MKENVIIGIMSIATVAIGMLIAFIESIILVGQGASAAEAIIISLYSGFLLWVILGAGVIMPPIIDKLIGRAER